MIRPDECIVVESIKNKLVVQTMKVYRQGSEKRGITDRTHENRHRMKDSAVDIQILPTH